MTGDVAGFVRGAAFTVCVVAAQLALRAFIRWLLEYSRASLENAFKGRLCNATCYTCR